MIIKRFRFVSPGDVTVGVVRGKEDRPVPSLQAMHHQQTRALSLMPLTVFEPKEGHVAVYTEYQEDAPGPVDFIDLRNPDLKILELNLNKNEPVFTINP